MLWAFSLSFGKTVEAFNKLGCAKQLIARKKLAAVSK
jgi:hypothetical protein